MDVETGILEAWRRTAGLLHLSKENNTVFSFVVAGMVMVAVLLDYGGILCWEIGERRGMQE